MDIGSSGFSAGQSHNKQERQEILDKRVARMCEEAQSGQKKVLVVDDFYATSDDATRATAIDFDGDLEQDKLLHGDVVQKYLEKDGIEVTPYQCTPQRLGQCLNDIANQVETGAMEKPAFLNISRATEYSEDELRRFSGIPDLKFNQLADRKDEVVQSIRQQFEDGERAQKPNPFLTMSFSDEPLSEETRQRAAQALQHAYRALFLSQHTEIERLNQLGVPTVFAAGNRGPERFSTLTLADVISVGALEPDGTKSSYSADNKLVTHWRQGSYPIKPVEGGYDITGNGKADVTPEHLSGGPSYVGRSVREPGMIVDVNGKLRSLRTHITGTSYAAPSICSNENTMPKEQQRQP